MTTIFAAFAVLSLLMSVHELGHLVVAKWTGLQVDEFGLGYPPRLLTLGRWGGTDYTLNLIFFGAFVRLAEKGAPGTIYPEQRKRVRAAFLVGGPLFNLLLSVALFSVCFATGWPVAHDLAVGVNKVLPGSVAAAVGFEDNDLILAADGYAVSSVPQLILYARSVNGEIRMVTIRRRGRIFELRLPPGAPWFVKPETRGVQLHNTTGWEEIVTYPLPEAIHKATIQTLTALSALLSIPLGILRGLIPVDMVRPVGPIGIAQWSGLAARQVADSGWWFPLLQLTATLSAALAVTNLLPLPGLDGGHLLFVAVEALRGRRLDPGKENLVHLIGIILMLMLVLVVTYYDIAAPLPWGGH